MFIVNNISWKNVSLIPILFLDFFMLWLINRSLLRSLDNHPGTVLLQTERSYGAILNTESVMKSQLIKRPESRLIINQDPSLIDVTTGPVMAG